MSSSPLAGKVILLLHHKITGSNNFCDVPLFSSSLSFAGALVPIHWRFRSIFFDTDIMFFPLQEVSSADPDESKPVWADPSQQSR